MTVTMVQKLVQNGLGREVISISFQTLQNIKHTVGTIHGL